MKDGGPAFARPCGSITGEEWNTQQEVMRLRDFFAAQAIIGLTQRPGLLTFDGVDGLAAMDRCIVAAKSAYRIADAMLAAREAP